MTCICGTVLESSELAKANGFRRHARDAGWLFDEIIVDLFAGGGGTSLGVEMALGRSVDVAINHDRTALDCHMANHPATEHRLGDIWHEAPKTVCHGRPVGLLMASPDCRHFSNARGAAPVSKRVRALAWVVVRWAKDVKPRCIIVENVREFQTWGPVIQNEQGQDVPDPSRKGETFRRWVRRLELLGYRVEWKVCNAADYGVPTHRRRLFIIARRDGEAIRWPEVTHGQDQRQDSDGVDRVRGRREGRGRGDAHARGNRRAALLPYRTAAECIDWTIPCPSIFDRPRPLAEKTLRRIAHGLKRYVIDSPRPYIVSVTWGDRAGEVRRGPSIDEPIGVINSRHEHALVVPQLVQTGYGERPGQAPRSLDIGQPLGTVVGGGKHALVAAMMQKFYGGGGGVVGHEMERPIGAITGIDGHAIAAATLVGVGGRAGCTPPTPIDAPCGVITGKADRAVVAATLTQFRGSNQGKGSVEDPAPAICGQGTHAGLVYAFLTKYFGQGVGCTVDAPCPTVTGKDRFGLVIVQVGGVPHVIVDIGLRMLTPRELARCQGFPDDFVLPTVKRDAVRLIGNSVCPGMAAALVKANVPEMVRTKGAA